MMQALKSQFGLEAIILHEKLSEAMHDFLPNSSDIEEHTYYTVCYLTLSNTQSDSNIDGGSAINTQYESGEVHTSFRQTLEPSMLSISEKQRFRFFRAMKQLMIKPHYHLSELEPHVIHPMKDDLADICSCREIDCPGEAFDIHSWDRPYCLESAIEQKSEGKPHTLTYHGSCTVYLLRLDRTCQGVMAETVPSRCFRCGHALWHGRVRPLEEHVMEVIRGELLGMFQQYRSV
jgi:hypothetical protein